MGRNTQLYCYKKWESLLVLSLIIAGILSGERTLPYANAAEPVKKQEEQAKTEQKRPPKTVSGVPLLASIYTCEEIRLLLRKGMSYDDVSEVVGGIALLSHFRLRFLLADGSLFVFFNDKVLDEWFIVKQGEKIPESMTSAFDFKSK